MSTSITFNGTSYTVPAIADASWGTNVANYLIAISTGCLQKTGGTFTLTAELNFGSNVNCGIKALYLKSQTANISSTGFLALAKTDALSWRNNANAADLALAINGSDQVTFNGAILSPMTTKGDLPVFDSTNNRLAVGTDGYVLTASSVASTGLAWAAGASTTLAQFNTDIGNASNVRTGTNTNLLGDIKGTTLSQTATMTIAAPGVVTSNAHGMALGDKFYFTTTGALPTGVTASTTYYAANIATNTFNISTSLANAAAGTYVTTSGSQSGTHTLVTGGLVQTSGTKGTVTNDSPTAGYVGQLVESITLKAAAVSLTNSTEATVLSTAVTLTPGHWNIYGFAGFTGTSSSLAVFRAEISTGSTLPGAPPTNPYSAADSRDGYSIYGVPGGANLGNGDIIQAFPINTCKIAPGGTQTINIVAKATWTGNAVSAYGRISAVRVR